MTGLSSAQHNILHIPFWIHATITIHKSQNKVKSLTSGMYMETLTLPRLRTGESLFIRDVTALTSSLCTAMSRRRKRQEQCDVRKYFWLRSAQWSKIKFKQNSFSPFKMRPVWSNRKKNSQQDLQHVRPCILADRMGKKGREKGGKREKKWRKGEDSEGKADGWLPAWPWPVSCASMCRAWTWKRAWTAQCPVHGHREQSQGKSADEQHAGSSE